MTPAKEATARLSALLVLGRGIAESGQPSETSKARAKIAIDIARDTLPDIVVFSGGHSWAQELQHIITPSEGGAMLTCAMHYLAAAGPAALQHTAFRTEETSISTVENMVNSKPLLKLKSGDTLGILSDKLHCSQGRVAYLAKLVFPNTDIRVYDIVPFEYPPAAEAEEKRVTQVTKLFMAGVESGNGRAIMRRQRALEHVNAIYRQLRRD